MLLAWAHNKAGGFGPILSQPSAFDPGQARAGQFWNFFVPALTGMIGYWATLSLNIPDFSRYALGTQADQILGQVIGLPPTMALYSFIGVAVTSATAIIYGNIIWDPTDVLTRFTNPAVLIIAMLALCVATLATNIAANVVSPANDFAHLAPKRISFRLGGFITGVVGIVMMPWKLLADLRLHLLPGCWATAYRLGRLAESSLRIILSIGAGTSILLHCIKAMANTGLPAVGASRDWERWESRFCPVFPAFWPQSMS